MSRVLVAHHSQGVRHSDPGMAKDRVRDRYSVVVILARGVPAARFVPVKQRPSEDQMIQIHHHHCLDKVTVNRISHPRPSRLDLDPAAPCRVITVDLVLTCGVTILAEENGAAELSCMGLVEFDGEPERAQVFIQASENLVAGQSLGERCSAYRGIMLLKNADDLGNEWLRRLRTRKCREAHAGHLSVSPDRSLCR